jgi:hypothetical protein
MRWLAATLVVLCSGLAQAQEFEGTWKLTARKLPNGATLTPPAVQGAIMCQSGMWTRVVFWQTPEGKPASFSAVSNYKFAPAEFTETLLFSASDDGSFRADHTVSTRPTHRLLIGTVGLALANDRYLQDPLGFRSSDERLLSAHLTRSCAPRRRSVE